VSKKYITTWFYAKLGKCQTDVGGLFPKMKETYSQRAVDFDEYAKLLEEKYNELDSDGYDVVNVLPINMGQAENVERTNIDISFSITRGAVVVGKKRD
jgi:hypothetical protein